MNLIPFSLPRNQHGRFILLLIIAFVACIRFTPAAANILPDLNVTYIERTPRYESNAAKNMPAAGETVIFRGHVRNWDAASPAVSYRWELDGVLLASGDLAGMQPDEERIVEQPWSWQPGPHELRFCVDSNNQIAELSERNNCVQIRTNGLSAVYVVEQSVYNYFRTHMKTAGTGGNSWEDWVQQGMLKGHQTHIDAVHPNTPDGIRNSWFVDHFQIVPDNSLRADYLPFHPGSMPRIFDGAWGFMSSRIVPADRTYNAWVMSQNEGHTNDLARINFHLAANRNDINNSATRVQVPHMENGVPVAGSSLMPWLDGGASILHYNQSSGRLWGAWRGWSPVEAEVIDNIGQTRATMDPNFPNAHPQRNHLRLVEPTTGRPVANANVKLYRQTPYSHSLSTNAFAEYTSDADGFIHLPKNPFYDGARQTAGPMVLLRIESGNLLWYRFLEEGMFNLEYWRGNQQDASYTLELPLPGSPSWIEVHGYEQWIPSGSTEPQVGNLTHFGTTSASRPLVRRSFVVKNRGGTNMVGVGTTLSGRNADRFSVLLPVDGGVIHPHTLRGFQLEFIPKWGGLQRATVSVKSDNATLPVYTFAISAMHDGVLAPATLQSAVAGDERVTLGFTTLGSDTGHGDNRASSYTATCSAPGQTSRSMSGNGSPLIVNNLSAGMAWSCSVLVSNRFGNSPASNSLSVTPTKSIGPQTLSVSVTGIGAGASSVSSNPAGINCGKTCSATLAGGTVVTLSAKPGNNKLFEGWGGACSGKASTCVLTMSQARTVSAKFGNGVTAPGEPKITAITAGIEKASIHFSANAANAEGYSAACSASGQTTRSSSGSAAPLVVSGLKGGVVYACTITAQNSVGKSNPSKPVKVTPLLPVKVAPVLPGFTLTLKKSGKGTGSVVSATNAKSNPAVLNCGSVCSATVESGASVQLSAKAANGHRFVGWSSACSGSASTCTVKMDAAKTVQAQFEPGR